jgi:hypothetical protein
MKRTKKIKTSKIHYAGAVRTPRMKFYLGGRRAAMVTELSVSEPLEITHSTPIW